jgi:hypothetical protein
MAEQSDIPTPWIGLEELPIHFANAFGASPAPNAIFVMFGSVMPLGVDGSGQAYAPVHPVVRLAIAPDNVRQLIQALESTLKQRDAIQQSRD